MSGQVERADVQRQGKITTKQGQVAVNKGKAAQSSRPALANKHTEKSQATPPTPTRPWVGCAARDPHSCLEMIKSAATMLEYQRKLLSKTRRRSKNTQEDKFAKKTFDKNMFLSNVFGGFVLSECFRSVFLFTEQVALIFPLHFSSFSDMKQRILL